MSSRKIRVAFLAVLVLSLVALVATSIAVAAGRDHGKNGKNGKGQFVAQSDRLQRGSVAEFAGARHADTRDR